MARDFAKVCSGFWTGETGVELRSRPDAQLIALYLMTCPQANMIGLFYLPLSIIVHETGRTEAIVLKALAELEALGFAYYDRRRSLTWVPEMARYQIGEELRRNDNRIKWVVKELEPLRKTPFYAHFANKYWALYNLPGKKPEAPPEGAYQGPSDPLRSQKIEQKQEQEQKINSPPEAPSQNPLIDDDPRKEAASRSKSVWEELWEQMCDWRRRKLQEIGLEDQEDEKVGPALINTALKRAYDRLTVVDETTDDVGDLLLIWVRGYLESDFGAGTEPPFCFKGFVKETLIEKWNEAAVRYIADKNAGSGA